MDDEVGVSAKLQAEVTVSTPMTPDQFVQYLSANGFIGNTSTNPNYPGVVWIEFRNGI